jgi:two-component system sensor histidine kinase/response regulator
LTGLGTTLGAPPPGPFWLLPALTEDNAVNRKLATERLRKCGHRTWVASDGDEALQLYRAGRFDAVLMDVHMPKVDGFAATALIRQAEKGTEQHVPIIAMTACAMKGDQERCLLAGMDAYFSKPIRAAELDAAMDAVADA